MSRKFFLCCLFAILFCGTNAQNLAFKNYIDTYKDVAIDHMRRYGIPASITLAQGLLESGAGRSDLSVRANNHFGIKCGGDWTGPYVLKNDDHPNEKFRAYSSAKDSYEDHAKFLTTRSRYAFLFNYDTTDYVNWAKGLKKAGYATNPRYADNLISLIEKYDLSRYDYASKMGNMRLRRHGIKGKMDVEPMPDFDLVVRKCNDNYYVVARQDDSFESISEQTGVSARKLRKYNEVDKKYQLRAGDIVYLEKKRNSAAKSLGRQYRHTVTAGESLYSIAQTYGIQLKALYKYNNLPEDYVAQVGAQLRVR